MNVCEGKSYVPALLDLLTAFDIFDNEILLKDISEYGVRDCHIAVGILLIR